MKFNKLVINRWQQFEELDINFHPRLTVLTGANGSGKTTILSQILARHAGWNNVAMNAPKKNKLTGIFSSINLFYNGKIIDHTNIGTLEYSNNSKATINVPSQLNSAIYTLQIENLNTVDCVYIPANRLNFWYQQLANIPINKKNRKEAYNDIFSTYLNRHNGQHIESPSYHMKGTLIGWAIQGYGVRGNDGKDIMPRDIEQSENFEGFQEVLLKLLPNTLGFERIEIRDKEIVFVCNGGNDDFILEQASGGVSALIDIAWHIYMYSTKEKQPFTAIIDEIENHLHPVMQREILPKLLLAFPQVSFIVSTHSPLVVGSVKDSKIYALKYNESKKIHSKELDLVGEPKTATEILEEILGVSFTIPIWAEDSLKEIVNKYSKKNFESEDFTKLRNDLREAGLEKFAPRVVTNVIENIEDAQNK